VTTGPRHPPVVAVIGGHRATPEETAAARTIGARLAAGGAIVLTGGRGGVMAAASRGAADAGGLVVGLLPGEDRADANPWLTLALPTGLGEARNTLVVRAADVVVAVGGEHGTLAELGFALKLRRPVIGLHTWVVARDGRPDPGIVVAGSATEAAELALRALPDASDVPERTAQPAP
jgi:uncharacterized protein (TIGR00725 family)